MKYSKVVILGAGAVGCYVFWGLSNKKEIEVAFVAEDERKVRLEREGLVINGRRYQPAVKTPDEAHGADLVIVTTKYPGLHSVMPCLKKIVDENTVVMSLLNGVDSEAVIAESIGEQHVVPALIKVASERNGNVVKFNPETTIGIIFGEVNGQNSTRTNALEDLFEGTGLDYRKCDAVMSEIWCKYRLNVSLNLPQALIGCGVGAYEDSEHVAFLRDALAHEVEQIAAAKGIDLSKADPSASRGSKVAKRARYSTLQDLDAGRTTEIDMFAGTMVRMGKELGIPTPFCEFIFHAIHALEEKNAGLFEYE